MNILHVIDSADPEAGGPVEAIRNLVNSHEMAGHRVDVVTLDSPSAPWLKTSSGTWHGLGGGSGGYALSFRFAKWLNHQKSDYDAIVINGLWKFPGLAVWWALDRMKHGKGHGRKPYVVYPHGMLDPWFKHQYPAKYLKKAFYWSLFERRVLEDAAAVCFTCEEERLLARDTFRPYRCHERVVGLGIVSPPDRADEQEKAFLTEYPALGSEPFLLFLSRLHEKKGVDLLLRAYAALAVDGAAHLPPLVVAGPPKSPAYLESLQALAKDLGLQTSDGRIPSDGAVPTVHFLPMLSGDVKWGAFRKSEAFVLPSHQENFGIAVVEALACGKPVLISNKVNIWREIAKNEAGLIADDTVEGTQQSLSQWAAMSPDDKKRMSGNARRCFANCFHIQAAAASLICVIEDVISAKNSTTS